MLQGDTKTQPIIADPDADFLKSMNDDPQAKDLPPLLASTSAEAIKLLSQPGFKPSAIFINPDLEVPHSASILSVMGQNHPTCPIYFITSVHRPVMSSEDLEKLTVRKVIQKPATYTELLRAANMLPQLFNADEAMTIANLDNSTVGVEQARDDSKFFAIQASKFVSGSVLLFNVYKKVHSGRYLKILQAGDIYAPATLTQFIEQNSAVYLTTESCSYYLKYSNWLCAALIGKVGVPFSVKLSYVLSIGEQVVFSLNQSNYSRDSLKAAHYFIERLRELAQELSPNEVDDLKNALMGCSDYGAELLATVISVILVKEIDYRATRSFQVVGISSLLQNVSAEHLDALANRLDPTVTQTLRRDEKDTKRFKSTVSEIVETSAVMANLIKKTKSLRDLNFQIEVEVLSKLNKSSTISTAFRSTFVKFASASN